MDTIPQDTPQDNLTPETTFIYRLRDPETFEIRYVGKANDPQERLKAHMRDCGDTYKGRWIASLRKRGLRPILEIIEEIPYELWTERECYWIEFYRAQGAPLTNTANGGKGGGTQPKTLAHRTKIADGHRGKKKSPESVVKSANSKRGKKLPPRTDEWKRAISKSNSGKKRSPKQIANMVNARKGKPLSPKASARLVTLNKSRTGQKREPMSDAQKRKLSEAQKRVQAIKRNPPNTPTLWG